MGLNGMRHQEAFDNATKVFVLVVGSVAIEPCSTQLHDLWTQRDALGSKKIDEAADRCERVASADGHKHEIAFTDAHVWLGGLDECPRQVRFSFVLHCGHRGSVVSRWRSVRTGAVAWGQNCISFALAA